MNGTVYWLNLENGSSASEPHIVLLADQLTTYLQQDSLPLIPYQPGLWTRFNHWLQKAGEKLGRKNHRRLIIVITTLLSFNALLTVLLLVGLWLSPEIAGIDILAALVVQAKALSSQNPVWLVVRLFLELTVGLLFGFVLLRFKQGHEQSGVDWALFASLLSITAVNLLTFYLDRFGALVTVIATFFIFTTFFHSIYYSIDFICFAKFYQGYS